MDKSKKYRYANGSKIHAIIFDVPCDQRIITISEWGDIFHHNKHGECFSGPENYNQIDWNLVEINPDEISIVWERQKQPVNVFVRVLKSK